MSYFLIAKTHSASGVNGFVRIISFSDFPERFFSLKKVYVDFSGEKKKFTVQKVQKKKDIFFIKFEGFDNDRDVKLLLHKEIFIEEKDLIKLPEDHYFIHDLIGSSVYKDDVFLGSLKDVLILSANDVYVIDKEGEEILIPAVKSFIDDFDAKKKVLKIKPDVDL